MTAAKARVFTGIVLLGLAGAIGAFVAHPPLLVYASLGVLALLACGALYLVVGGIIARRRRPPEQPMSVDRPYGARVP